MPSQVVISLMSRDRVGIIAAVAKSIFSLNGTICAISQTVMDQYFTILLTADFAGDHDLDDLRRGLEAAGGPAEFHVSVRKRETAQPRGEQARRRGRPAEEPGRPDRPRGPREPAGHRGERVHGIFFNTAGRSALGRGRYGILKISVLA